MPWYGNFLTILSGHNALEILLLMACHTKQPPLTRRRTNERREISHRKGRQRGMREQWKRLDQLTVGPLTARLTRNHVTNVFRRGTDTVNRIRWLPRFLWEFVLSLLPIKSRSTKLVICDGTTRGALSVCHACIWEKHKRKSSFFARICYCFSCLVVSSQKAYFLNGCQLSWQSQVDFNYFMDWKPQVSYHQTWNNE